MRDLEKKRHTKWLWDRSPEGRASQAKSRAKRKASGKTAQEQRRRTAKGQSAAAVAAKRRWAERNREAHNASASRWQKENPQYQAEQQSRRRLLKRMPLHPAFQAEVEGLYLFCKIFPAFQVDHVIPVKHERVCGLHVPWNLQVLTATENKRKGNKFYEEAA